MQRWSVDSNNVYADQNKSQDEHNQSTESAKQLMDRIQTIRGELTSMAQQHKIQSQQFSQNNSTHPTARAEASGALRLQTDSIDQLEMDQCEEHNIGEGTAEFWSNMRENKQDSPHVFQFRSSAMVEQASGTGQQRGRKENINIKYSNNQSKNNSHRSSAQGSKKRSSSKQKVKQNSRNNSKSDSIKQSKNHSRSFSGQRISYDHEVQIKNEAPALSYGATLPCTDEGDICTIDPHSQIFHRQVPSGSNTLNSDDPSPLTRLNVVPDKIQSHLQSNETLNMPSVAMPISSIITSPVIKRLSYQQQENQNTNSNMTSLEQAECFAVELQNLDQYYKKLIMQERESFQIILSSKINIAERDAERKLEKQIKDAKERLNKAESMQNRYSESQKHAQRLIKENNKLQKSLKQSETKMQKTLIENETLKSKLNNLWRNQESETQNIRCQVEQDSESAISVLVGKISELENELQQRNGMFQGNIQEHCYIHTSQESTAQPKFSGQDQSGYLITPKEFSVHHQQHLSQQIVPYPDSARITGLPDSHLNSDDVHTFAPKSESQDEGLYCDTTDRAEGNANMFNPSSKITSAILLNEYSNSDLPLEAKGLNHETIQSENQLQFLNNIAAISAENKELKEKIIYLQTQIKIGDGGNIEDYKKSNIQLTQQLARAEIQLQNLEQQKQINHKLTEKYFDIVSNLKQELATLKKTSAQQIIDVQQQLKESMVKQLKNALLKIERHDKVLREELYRVKSGTSIVQQQYSQTTTEMNSPPQESDYNPDSKPTTFITAKTFSNQRLSGLINKEQKDTQRQYSSMVEVVNASQPAVNSASVDSLNDESIQKFEKSRALNATSKFCYEATNEHIMRLYQARNQIQQQDSAPIQANHGQSPEKPEFEHDQSLQDTMSQQSLIGQKLKELRQEMTDTTKENKKAKDKVAKKVKKAKERSQARSRQSENVQPRKKSNPKQKSTNNKSFASGTSNAISYEPVIVSSASVTNTKSKTGPKAKKFDTQLQSQSDGTTLEGDFIYEPNMMNVQEENSPVQDYDQKLNYQNLNNDSSLQLSGPTPENNPLLPSYWLNKE